MDINDVKAYMRDINLEILMDYPDVTIDISKRYNTKFRWFYPNRKLIKYVTEIGGVLVGSRAIRCYTIRGNSLLNRRVNDWDFVVTLDMAFRICDEMCISKVPKIGDTISIKKQRRWVHPAYSDSYRVGPVDVQLIVREELPEYTEIQRQRISNFGYSISQKIDIVNDIQQFLPKNGRYTSTESERRAVEEYSKHISDLKEIIIKFNSIKIKLKNEN